MSTQHEKDQKIIEDNPGLEPYEYQALGVSDAAYQRLLKEQPEGEKKKGGRPKKESVPAETETPQVKTLQIVQPKAEQVKATPTVTEVNIHDNRAKPNVHQDGKIYSGGQAIVLNTKTGKQFSMSREMAIKKSRNRSYLQIVG
jgi:hypothetical protein